MKSKKIVQRRKFKAKVTPMNGFLAFNVVDGAINITAKTGIFSRAYNDAVGSFNFKLTDDDGKTSDYQVNVSNAGTPIVWTMNDPSDLDFGLIIQKLEVVDGVLQMTPYNPDILCTVTIERMA